MSYTSKTSSCGIQSSTIIEEPETIYVKKVCFNHITNRQLVSDVKKTTEHTKIKSLDIKCNLSTALRYAKPKLSPINGTKITLNRSSSEDSSDKKKKNPDDNLNKNQLQNSINFLKHMNKKQDNELKEQLINNKSTVNKIPSNKHQTQKQIINLAQIPFSIKGSGFILNDVSAKSVNLERQYLFGSKASELKSNLNNGYKRNLTKSTNIRSGKQSKENNNNINAKKEIKFDFLEPILNKCKRVYTNAVTSSSQLIFYPLNAGNNILSVDNDFINNASQVSKLYRKISLELEREKNNNLKIVELKETGDTDKIQPIDSKNDICKFYECDKTSLLLNRIKKRDYDGINEDDSEQSNQSNDEEYD